ncbi:hypothetical protein LG047_12555 [Methylocystis sp. WRRC1]|uniref:hypothetical protein n=1 Tax=unclassified Methylocystis TaxID=2625913 RepID=UPI0001F86A92|nr:MULTISPECIES: hypothetical protein [unclassified Methylocystis]MCC3246141.1 hypothetical protein [Methylocystis sp. WRRC1]
MTAFTRASLIDQARVHALRDAIVAALAARFADIEVKAHYGKLDISDVMKKGVFNAPGVYVAATRILPDGRLSGADDFEAQMTAYVVAEDLMVAGRRVERDEMALAICEGLLKALTDDDFARWGVENIGEAREASAAPLFTARDFAQGCVYYAVTWKQTLYAVADASFFTGDDA